MKKTDSTGLKTVRLLSLSAKMNENKGGGRNFERPNVQRLMFRNIKITGEGQNFEQ